MISIHFLGGPYKIGLLPKRKDWTSRKVLLLLVFLVRSYMSSTMPAPLVCRTIAEDREDAVAPTHCMGLEELPRKTLAGLTAIFFWKTTRRLLVNRRTTINYYQNVY